jgi:hypothetical protein
VRRQCAELDPASLPAVLREEVLAIRDDAAEKVVVAGERSSPVSPYKGAIESGLKPFWSQQRLSASVIPL